MYQRSRGVSYCKINFKGNNARRFEVTRQALKIRGRADVQLMYS
jgi:hypothetical protein